VADSNFLGVKLYPEYEPGGTVRLSTTAARSGLRTDNSKFKRYTVVETQLSPLWIGKNPLYKPQPDRCAPPETKQPEASQCDGEACLPYVGHDVAFVVTAEDIDGDTLPVSTLGVPEDSDVTAFGSTITDDKNCPDGRFQIQSGPGAVAPKSFWESVAANSAPGVGSVGRAVLAALATGNFIETAGSLSVDGVSDLQRGDSGGPLVYEGKVVGVHSTTTGGAGNSHARLDGVHAVWVQNTMCPPAEGKAYDAKSGRCK
jgi:hypothetical protein